MTKKFASCIESNDQQPATHHSVKNELVFVPQFEGRFLNCTFEFECPESWSMLTPTEDKLVRHCGTCGKPVTFCTEQDDLDKLTASGACVALYRPLTKARNPNVRLGLPKYVFDEDGIGRPYTVRMRD